MIERGELVRLAKARGLAPWQEEKRYVQALALHALRREEMAMKGGTYLWFFHGLDRFSEDLDFTAVGDVGPGTAKACVDSLGIFGVVAEVKAIKDDRFTHTFRIDARGPLYQGEQSLCRVTVEVSRREKLLVGPVSSRLDEAGYLLPVDLIRGMALSEVAAEKARALLRRGEVRDAYDLWFLLKRKKVDLDLALVEKKLGFYGVSLTPMGVAASLEKACTRLTGGLKPLVFGEVPSFEAVRDDITDALGAWSSMR